MISAITMSAATMATATPASTTARRRSLETAIEARKRSEREQRQDDPEEADVPGRAEQPGGELAIAQVDQRALDIGRHVLRDVRRDRLQRR